MKTEHSGATPVEDSTNTKTKVSFPTGKAKRRKMNQIPYYHRGNYTEFPEDTIIKEKDHAGGHTTYYVFVGRTLVRTKRTHMNSPHYSLARRLKEQYGQDLAGPKHHWNPLDHRIDDYTGDKYSVDTPAEFVEMQSHEAEYA